MRVVVDTNVLVVANARDESADLELAARAGRFLESVREGVHVMLEDNQDLAFAEYKTYMNFAGQPGVGDYFFSWFLRARWGESVERVQLTRSPLSEYLPADLGHFDPSDHKWIAIYVEGDGDAIVNASDSDWREAEAELRAGGIVVLELDAS